MDSNATNILRVVGFLLTALLCYADYYFLSVYPIIMWILIAIFAALFILGIVVWLPLFFGAGRFELTDNEVIVSLGWLCRVRTFMKLSAVQYVVTVHTPFSKTTGFNFLLIQALGGVVIIPFISYTDCTELENVLGRVVMAEEKE